MREAGLLPFLDLPEEVRILVRAQQALVPVKELLTDALGVDVRPAEALCLSPCRRVKGAIQQLRQRFFRQRLLFLCLCRYRVEVAKDLVVNRIEQQQAFALSLEVLAQIVADQQIQNRQLIQLRQVVVDRLACDVLRIAGLEQRPVYRDVRGAAPVQQPRLLTTFVPERVAVSCVLT